MGTPATRWLLLGLAGATALALVLKPSEPAQAEEPVSNGPALFNRFCVQCHGSNGDGQGPARPYLWPAPRNFSAEAFKYKSTPAGQPPSDDDLRATIREGVAGSSMPGFAVSLKTSDVDALIAVVKSFSPELWAGGAAAELYPAPTQRQPNEALNRTQLPAEAIESDKSSKYTRAGYYKASVKKDEDKLFGSPIRLQVDSPEEFVPAQATQSALQCARCHDKQYSEWKGSLHSEAASPGLIAQLVEMEAAGHGGPAESCQRCHAPLAEQHPLIRPQQGGFADEGYSDNPKYRDELRAQGINCASCHMRGWRRFGPPNPSASLLRMPNYPVRQVEQFYTYLELYERGDFCMPCHQLPPRQAINGKPLLNTYKEWLEGPYMRRGIQCQHCHMPNREHRWRGVHDPDTFRQGIRLDTIAARSAQSGVVSVRSKITNVGAGHYLPTTPTPAAWLRIELVGADGTPIEGAVAEQRIGRKVEYRAATKTERGHWEETEDTRIPPGESLELARAWKGGATARATHVKVSVRVHPDDYYQHFYERRLREKHSKQSRRLFLEALERARASRYLAEERLVEIE